MKQLGVVDIAREAGVSTATVSRVLNGSDRVSAATRSRVLEVIERRGFQPNIAASNLRRGRNPAIGLAVASISQPWYAKLIRATRSAITARGYTTLIYDLEHSTEVLLEHIESARRLRLSGMILATGDRLDQPRVRRALEELTELVPLVVIGQPLENSDWTTLLFDDAGASEAATRELLERRHRPVLFLGSPQKSFLSELRLEGVRRALQDYPDLERASTMQHLSLESTMNFLAGYNDAASRARTLRDYGLVFCVNDEIALGVCRAAGEMGLRIPEDLMVLGYGDSDFLPYVTPSISSLSSDVGPVANDALEAIMARMSGEPTETLRVYSRHIVHRESTAIA